jgi:hypothetical protein
MPMLIAFIFSMRAAALMVFFCGPFAALFYGTQSRVSRGAFDAANPVYDFSRVDCSTFDDVPHWQAQNASDLLGLPAVNTAQCGMNRANGPFHQAVSHFLSQNEVLQPPRYVCNCQKKPETNRQIYAGGKESLHRPSVHEVISSDASA